ncbi:basic-leucine zipper transcription factor f-related [Anaeramoeba flamelloides]|uniref:Basic-leucine zipper transcription factor f-related n=1 Tax=Anaeramoeba flamelloides TaxID=1746091 RepID=A0AAV8ALC9_9EUKA|nr:basic-leucine zipper transcription factor f-related [Anaeramoeba flamelloides]
MDQFLYQLESKPLCEFNFSDLLKTDETRLENSIFEEIPLSNKNKNTDSRRIVNPKNYQAKGIHPQTNQTQIGNNTTKREKEKVTGKKKHQVNANSQLGNIKSKQIKSIRANFKDNKKAVSLNQETEQSPLKGVSKVQQTKKRQPRKRGRTLKPDELKKRIYLSSIKKIDNVKDLTKEERRLRRLERNRESARRTREKKKMQEMKKQNEISKLQKLVATLQKEILVKDEAISKISKLIPSDPVSIPTNKRLQIVQILHEHYPPNETNRNNRQENNTTKTIDTHPNNGPNVGAFNAPVMANKINSNRTFTNLTSKDLQSKDRNDFDLLNF